jgi:WD40 repeat protein
VSRDERWVAAATSAGPIALYTGDGTPVAMLSGHRGGTEAVAVSPDGGLVVSGGQDRVIRVWRTAAPAAPPIELGPIDNDTRQLVFARGGRLVIGSGDDGKVRAWSVLGTTVDPGSMRVLAAHQDGVIALASDGEDRVVSIGRNRGRNEIDLGHGSVRAVPASAASRAPDGPGGLRRALALPIPGGRDLWVTADGKAIVVHTAGRGDLAALRARLLSP